MKNQPAMTISEMNPVEKEEIVQMMMMTFLPMALMVIRLGILAMHG